MFVQTLKTDKRNKYDFKISEDTHATLEPFQIYNHERWSRSTLLSKWELLSLELLAVDKLKFL